MQVLRLLAAFALSQSALGLALPHTGKCDCSGTSPVLGNTNSSTATAFLCGDPRLGPAHLPGPDEKSVHPLLRHYERLGGLCPGAFLAKFTSPTGAYVYPPDLGFQRASGGGEDADADALIDGNQTLTRGMLLDRFGSEYGSFLAPAFTPFAQRALPPSSLNRGVLYNVYRVEKEFVVLTGTIAAWFGQPGQGTQYLASDSVLNLTARGFLSRVEEQF